MSEMNKQKNQTSFKCCICKLTFQYNESIKAANLLITCHNTRGHTFCTKCITDKITTDGRFSCPDCNIGGELSDEEEGEREGYDPNNGESDYFDGPISESMFNKVEREGYNTTDDISNYCKKHNKMIILFCSTCNELICGKCFESHKSHSQYMVDPSIKSNECKKTINDLINKSIQKISSFDNAILEINNIIEKINKDTPERTEIIKKAFEKAFNLLKESQQKVIDESYQISNKKKEKLEEQSNRYLLAKKELNELCDNAEEAILRGEDINIIAKTLEIEKNLTEMINNSENLRPVTNDEIKFEIDPTIYNTLSHIGYVYDNNPCAKKTIASGDGLHNAKNGIPSNFQITIHKEDGSKKEHGGDEKAIDIEIKDEKVDFNTTDYKNGTYNVAYTVNTQSFGKKLLNVFLNGIKIKNSPFDLTIANNIIKGSIKGEFLNKFGSFGSNNIQFNYPYFLSISDNELYIADTYNHRIQIFFLDGVYKRQFGSKGSGNLHFKNPWCLCIVNNEIFIVDRYNHRIQVLSKTGSFIRSFGTQGSGNGQFLDPCGITYDDDEIYVSDCGNHRIQVLDRKGNYIRQFGRKGSNNGEFYSPCGITISNSEIYIDEFSNNRIQVVDKFGNYKRKFGSFGTGDGQFNYPYNITIYNDEVYVSDWNHRIQIFNKQGEFLRKFGTKGSGEGQFNNPTGLAIHNKILYVVDCNNNRIQTFK